VLFNEPKLLKLRQPAGKATHIKRFSALQRAEIAEMEIPSPEQARRRSFSALQRAEIAEIRHSRVCAVYLVGFSALQRAEIAEIGGRWSGDARRAAVSVLFNEPKLLKF